MLWKANYDKLKDELRKDALKNELASKFIEILGENVAILYEEVEQWNDAVNEMRQDNEEKIHSLMQKWVNNIEKKGKIVLWKYFSFLTVGTYFNLFFSIDTLGGYT